MTSMLAQSVNEVGHMAPVISRLSSNAENVPAELRDPFYCDQYEQEHLKPPVTRLLQSSELYCRTYSLLLGASGAEAQPKDNVALLELLTQKGIVSKDKDTLVTDADLRHKPIKMSAHLAVIDALMAVGAMETVTAVKTCSSAELLGGASSWEDALLHWVNGCPTRWYWKLVPLRYRKDKVQSKQKPIFPVVNEVKDLSSGCAVAAVIHYYCPGLLRLEDVCMKDSMSVADSLYNLQFIREFCDSCLKCCCHLALEDMLYTPQELQLNLLSFLAELLSWFEVQRPEFVQPIDTLDGSTPVTPSGNSNSPSIFKKPFLPISSPASGSLTQSTSMSHIEGVGKTWSKKPLSRPLSAVPTLSRVLTPPQNVDRIPHLRRVNPMQSQVQTSSSFSIGDSGSLDELRSSGPTPVPTPTLTPAPTPTPTPRPAADDTLSEVGSNDDQSIFSMDLEVGSMHGHAAKREGLAGGGCSSGAPSECSFESDAPAGMLNGKRSSLIEISLSALRDGEEDDQVPDAFSDSMSDRTEPEMKGGVGFFFKDDKEQPEDEMAQRRAALLEKQQKRTEEMKRRKLEQEKEKESNKPQWMIIEGWGNKSEDRPQTPGTPPASRTPPVEGTPQRRGDFTRQEYERRQQLKIMEDLDKVLRQKPTTVRGVKKQRPKTVFRDDSVLSHSPVKGFMGTKLNKVYSHSTMNLSSMANDSGGLSVRKSPSRSHSPSRLMSPRRTSSQNGDKDWENGSTISSPASIPEYTGPKLYKEPSFKSNKFIIHNAITRCCLAGKVNEPQKNKIVEEMEKSTANHFLILFRDSSCQFRAVYTMNPETEEMMRLTGIGPRIITPEMVESIYKYSSDRKQFTAIPSKTMSMSVDAFTIPGHFWQKRPGTPKKLGTPK
ncbi:calmodulin-regulated spectrin-associated protein 3 [Lates japonicus]|uniref:Calmodulin-regulated spectrin-associated protein 3 n=1 Tax=Lates japonicus TaxID=270547 RepID=A0AAD3RIQ2_LATJO|nr:calmodulin-regulated spectrin-associated protein 3 [Lates japonicus]